MNVGLCLGVFSQIRPALQKPGMCSSTISISLLFLYDKFFLWVWFIKLEVNKLVWKFLKISFQSFIKPFLPPFFSSCFFAFSQSMFNNNVLFSFPSQNWLWTLASSLCALRSVVAWKVSAHSKFHCRAVGAESWTCCSRRSFLLSQGFTWIPPTLPRMV